MRLKAASLTKRILAGKKKPGSGVGKQAAARLARPMEQLRQKLKIKGIIK